MSVRAIFRCSVLFTLLGVALWADAAPLWAADALPATPPATPPVVDSTLPTDTQENAATPDGEGERPPDTTPRFGFALKPTYMLRIYNGDLHHTVGPGFQFDYNAIPNWLDVSLELDLLIAGSISLIIPVDLFISVRLYQSDTIWPYVGIGARAMFSRVLAQQDYLGCLVLVGCKWRLFKSSGIIFELGYFPLYRLDCSSCQSLIHASKTSIGYWWRF